MYQQTNTIGKKLLLSAFLEEIKKKIYPIVTGFLFMAHVFLLHIRTFRKNQLCLLSFFDN